MNRKPAFLLLALLLSMINPSCSLLEQTGALSRFAKSRFELVGFRPLNIAGIDVSTKHHFSDFSYQEIFQLGKRFFSHELPSRVALQVRATNPFMKQASITGLSWIVMLKQDTLATGDIKQRIDIKPLSETRFPLVVQFNLLRLMRSGSLDKVLNLFLNQTNESDKMQQLGLMIKIKPWYMQGKKLKKYPGYITIKPDTRQIKASVPATHFK